ncbi:MAG: hypothetical protein H6Q90_3970 [Deltaproteobacteria bacterium]|nr:hypothetical protein [Deltaproteobacteria bacterium]
MRRVLLLDERILADGNLARSWGSVAGERLHIRDEDGPEGALSVVAVDRVMCRYGRPLDPEIGLSGDHLELPGGYRLRRLRFHAIVDAEARDYLVWERPDGEPLAAVGTMVTAALRYLVLRISGERPQETEA